MNDDLLMFALKSFYKSRQERSLLQMHIYICMYVWGHIKWEWLLYMRMVRTIISLWI